MSVDFLDDKVGASALRLEHVANSDAREGADSLVGGQSGIVIDSKAQPLPSIPQSQVQCIRWPRIGAGYVVA